MSETEIRQASEYLIGLARRLAQPYAALPEMRAIILTGSAAEGVSDFYSDLDGILYYDELPSEEALAAASEQNGGAKRRPIAPRGDDQFAEQYNVDGVECQFGHATVAAWEKDIASVLDDLQVASPIQKALGGMAEAIPLYGEPLIHQWQDRLAAYPDALAEAMVKHYLDLYPAWGLLERLRTRDASLWYDEMLVHSTQSLLGTLAGLNRLYFTTFQFKRMSRFLAGATVAPANCAVRIEAILHDAPETAAPQSAALMRETVALVEAQMPQVDTAHIHFYLDYKSQLWTPSSNGVSYR